MGRIKKPHGIKGELEVDWSGEYIPKTGDALFIGDSSDLARKWAIASIRPHQGQLLIQLQGLDNRTEAEAMRGLKVYMAEKDLPPLSEDEVYLQNLPGSEIYIEDGRLLGKLDHIEFPANQIIWSIQGVNGQEILFPAAVEFIKSINVGKKKIVISPPDGLLEIYGA